MINHIFISFSAVQMYDLSYIHLHWVILLAKIAVEGCLHPHFRVEFCQNLFQRAETLNRVVNISCCTPFSPYCQPCLRGLLCVFSCSLLVYLSLFLRLTQLKNGALQVQEQNVAVVVHEKTQLAVFPFVEFARDQRSCVHCGLCF